MLDEEREREWESKHMLHVYPICEVLYLPNIDTVTRHLS